MGDSKKRSVLVVEDDSTISASIAAAMRPSLDPHVVASVSEAEQVITSVDKLDGAVIDVMLPDGSGLDLATRLREQHALVPILILTGHAEPEFINRAHSLRAEYVCKPFFQDNLKEFLRRVVQAPSDDQWKLKESAQSFATRYSLSMRETEILSLAVTGVPRSHIAEVLGVSENTIKTQVRSILDKTRQSSLSDVVWMVRSPRD